MADLSNYTDQPRPVHSGSSVLAVLALVVVFIVVATVFGIAATALGPLFSNETFVFQNPAVGERLPNLQLVGLTGGTRDVTLSNLSGKVALVNFWGTWCGPCRLEAPHIAKLHAKYAQRGDFRLLSVSCGGGGNENLTQLRSSTQSFLAQSHLELPTYADPQSVTRQAFAQVGNFRGYPTTLLLDRDQTIRAVWVGFGPGVEKEMAAKIEGLLAK